ncbi:TIGR04282 family arsenosugar biosynthesis glycosyltransferase [Candidatus Binatia bacterium]|nr:TIGR04282 family arsenosugar biosynthesis glycosyltransferase [Candidatus Binatia bacterium]
MARYPTAGQVKTRLARALGVEPATALYRAFLADLAARFGNGPRPLAWLFHPPTAPFAEVVGAGARCLPQRGDDLATRLRHAFEDLTTSAAGLMVIGADVPHIPADRLAAADSALAAADVVLGPTDDGGYYLVAMHSAYDVFSGVEMGTDRVLEQTRARCVALGLRLHLIAPWFDLDEVGDLERLRALLGSDPTMAVELAHTATVLASIRK